MKNAFIIDTDPGVDDSLAIAISCIDKNSSVKLLTTTFGNHTIDQTTKNAIRLIDYLKKNGFLKNKIKIIKGSRHPLKRKFSPFLKIHGTDGMGDTKLFDKNTKYQKSSIDDELLNCVLHHKNKITLLCLGPLTNIAKFAVKYPESCKYFKEIVIMGGTLFMKGNMYQRTEANFGLDPEAAKTVLTTKFNKITIVPLDVTEQFQISKSRIQNITNKRLRTFVSEITRKYSQYYRHVKKYYTDPTNDKRIKYVGGALHDVLAFLISNSETGWFKTQKYNVNISTEKVGGGQLLFNTNPNNQNFSENKVNIIVKADIDKAWDIFYKIINNY